MKTETFDLENNRTIEKDYDLQTLTIEGDYSPSSITSYWVVNKFNLAVPIGIYITKDNAERRRIYLNKQHITNTFIIIKRTIFV